MMDIGIGRFLEMFEERFGKVASTIFLLVVGLALIGFSLNAIWVNIIVPTGSIVDLINTQPKNIAAIVYRFLLVVGNTVLFVILIPATIIMSVRTHRSLKTTAKQQKEIDQIAEIISAFIASLEKYRDKKALEELTKEQFVAIFSHFNQEMDKVQSIRNAAKKSSG